ncbi:hypothetical protein MMC07_009940, partial [Pseudocyphellaria aurata]|nr:hypothetical protein [Pseudocyphellaria aurata]
MTSAPPNRVLDVLIIGGGPAGLSVATGLARQLYTAVVFDSGVYRNALPKHMHNVATWDHRGPAEFRAAARDDILRRYTTIQFHTTTIQSVRKTPEDQFEATDIDGHVWTGRKLMLAAGVRDVYPDIDGYAECWAKSIFNCLFCHGFEERDSASAGVLAVGGIASVEAALNLGRMAKRLAPTVTIYTNGSEDLHDQIVLALKSDELKVEKRRISRLEHGSGSEHEQVRVIVHLEDGSSIREGFLAHKPKTALNGPFAHQLGLELTEQGDIKTTQPWHESSVPGVFAAGDCAIPLKAVTQALAMGTFGAAGLTRQLQ